MLDSFDDPEQRRRTGPILNKDEARNALARAIFSSRLGELRDRTFENQRHRASGPTLVTAAATLWSTVYLDRAVQHLRRSGIDVTNELLAYVAPLGWKTIGLLVTISGGIPPVRASASSRSAFRDLAKVVGVRGVYQR